MATNNRAQFTNQEYQVPTLAPHTFRTHHQFPNYLPPQSHLNGYASDTHHLSSHMSQPTHPPVNNNVIYTEAAGPSHPSGASSVPQLPSEPCQGCQKCSDLNRRVNYLETEFKYLKKISESIERPIITDGTFIWSIQDVSKKREPHNGYLESAVFYSALFGYKLQGCVYLNGDGIKFANNLSVYIVLLKGEHDSLLTWPFPHPVAITLMDQSKRKLDIEKTFQPTLSSSCFKQPLDHIKRPSGFPDFLQLPDLKEPFLVDDVMFLKFELLQS